MNNKWCSKREFQIRNLVYLKLQPYRQHSIRKMCNQKLSPRYFRPYPITAKRSKVAYTLLLPNDARIHPTFHASQLKKQIKIAPSSTTLPPADSEGNLVKLSAYILDRRIVKQGNHTTAEVLVEWSNTFLKDST